MAAPTGVNTTLVNIGNREDLEDKIYRVAPEETPFMSVIGRTEATAVTHEWQTETLAAASATNQLVEGDDVTTLDNPNLSARIGNICQINGKKYGVSGTQQKVKSAGSSGSLSRQRILKGLEARRDAELRMTGNYATVAESGATARKCGGALAGISSNVSLGAGGSVTAISASTWTAATPGTTRTFTEALVKSAQSSAFSNGARPSVAMMGPSLKQQWSAFTGIASIRSDVKDDRMATIIAGADVYVSDFGKITLVPHPYSLTTAVLGITPDMWAVGVLRGWKTNKLAKLGDSDREEILAEHTLVARNEKASWAIHAVA
jgi:hypothetical protein